MSDNVNIGELIKYRCLLANRNVVYLLSRSTMILRCNLLAYVYP
jgi:hypothetical protein